MSDKKIVALQSALYSPADALRAKMDANDYKDYLLGIIFYKYLSDQELYLIADLKDKPNISLKQAQELFESEPNLYKQVKSKLGYSIVSEDTFTNMINKIAQENFKISDLEMAIHKISNDNQQLAGLFQDVRLDSPRLGPTAIKRAATIAQVLQTLAPLEIVKTKGDTLGDAYEYLIGQFASEVGKKSGEFYTPQKISELLTKLALIDQDPDKKLSVYDPAMGSGSLLLNFKKYFAAPEKVAYYGQEINISTFNLAKMNMILHGVSYEQQHLHNGDTLEKDWPPQNFNAVVMNPPYSLKWSADNEYLKDPRFKQFGVLAPKSKADYAFLLHGFYHLKDNGTLAIVLPTGVLFRQAAEGKIRKQLLEMGAIDAVIELPVNLFYNTTIPTVVLVLKKKKQNRDVMFIDASREFQKEKKQNYLREKDIQHILTTYRKHENIDGYAHLASFDEIKDNGFNLNLHRYVDTFETQEDINLSDLAGELKEVDQQINAKQTELVGLLKKYHSKDAKTMKGLNDIIEELERELK